VAIYQENNPEKIKDVSSLLEKYDGKEDKLLQAVKKKYRVAPSSIEATAEAPNKKWSYVLKNVPVYKHRMRTSEKSPLWEVERSLENVREELDKIARSIGGECVLDGLGKQGQHRLVVQQSRFEDGYSGKIGTKYAIEANVERMRAIVHERYHRKANSSNFTDEHSCRKLNKQRDQERKKNQGKRNS
jgi:hypothetical protein